MLEFFLLLSLMYFAFKMGRAYQLFEMRKTIRKIAEENNVNLDDLLNVVTNQELEEKNIVLVKTEVIDDTILLYNISTNEFLGQANTIEEAAKVFNERKKNYTGAVLYNNDEFFFVDGKITKTL